MRITQGSRGNAVRDIQQRLLGLGYRIPAEELGGTFGPETLEAVRAFQQRRGLLVDGIVGRETWRQLVEASWRVGDRTLYLRSPQLRGDDIRDLQERLSALGFDAGRIDGIFGPQTAKATADFQHNYGVPADGIAGDSTFRALAGLPSMAGTTPVTSVREIETLRSMAPTLTGRTIVVDPGHGNGDPGCVGPTGAREDDVVFAIALRLEAALAAAGVKVFLTRDESTNPSDRARASLANSMHADLYIAIHSGGSDDPAACGAASFHFGHERFRSEAGAHLADRIQEELTTLGLNDNRTHGKTWGVLRETRMPAVQVEPCFITNPAEERLLADPAFQQRIAEAIATALRRFAKTPVPA